MTGYQGWLWPLSSLLFFEGSVEGESVVVWEEALPHEMDLGASFAEGDPEELETAFGQIEAVDFAGYPEPILEERRDLLGSSIVSVRGHEDAAKGMGGPMVVVPV